MDANFLLILRITLIVILYIFLTLAFFVIWQALKPSKVTSLHAKIPSLTLIATLESQQLENSFEKPEVLVGRDPNADFSINDDTISGRHAIFTYRQNQWWLEDLHSTNGSFLNQIIIEEPAVIVDGDQLRCGRVHISVNIS